MSAIIRQVDPFPGCRVLKRAWAIALLSVLSSGFLHAQERDRCGTVTYMETLRNENRVRESIPVFEKWLDERILQRRERQQSGRIKSGPYQVPVVVHIIHNGEAIGTGTNLSVAQIESEIAVLNKDFPRTNSDASSTPAEFVPVAGVMDIEFVLAKQDPEGLATNGITRTKGTKSGWNMDDNIELKSFDYWPAEDYLNIWVCNLTDLLGYAQFPVSSLPGLGSASSNRLTDGIVVAYDAFGSIDYGSFNLISTYSKGRTATHELGHYFGLRHIWGDVDECGASDFAEDTPDQLQHSSGCPSHPRASCGTNDMFQNYMDYTNDNCMNIFTADQVERMVTVIENSPRRNSLLTSHGLVDPSTVSNDLGIKSIVSPLAAECESFVVPTLQVRNYGVNMITSAHIKLIKNSVVVESKDFALSLDPLDESNVTFSPITIASNDILSMEITETNGTTDGNAFNDKKFIIVQLQSKGTIPFVEKFPSLPEKWVVRNLDSQEGWELVTAASGDPQNKAMRLDCFQYDNIGEYDVLLSPVYDFSALESATLSFDVAYRQFPDKDDELRVIVLTNCSSDLSTGSMIYDKAGAALATVAGTTTSAFAPSGAGDWGSEVRTLDTFVGASQVQLAFVAINDHGNNIYLDNITVAALAFEDISLESVVGPGPVICSTETSLQFAVKNRGPLSVIKFDTQYAVNGGPSQQLHFEDFSMDTEDQQVFTIPSLQLQSGPNTIDLEIAQPNGQNDSIPANNVRTYHLIVDENKDIIPLRENFESQTAAWIAINPYNGASWGTTATNLGTSISFNAFTDPVLGDKAWFVSPVLDFTASPSASMFFDYAYASNDGHHDDLRIYTSTDCGRTFNLSDSTLFSTAGSTISWTPAAASDWYRVYTDLTVLAGATEGRVAFVVTNDHGNNMYIDNIEFFTSADESPIQTEKPYVVYNGPNADFYITFNLEERQPVGIDVINSMGMTVLHALQENVLNQTFPVQFEGASGVYIVRVHTGTGYYATRVFVSR